MRPLLTPHQLPRDAVRSAATKAFDVTPEWTEIERFMDELEREGYELRKVNR